MAISGKVFLFKGKSFFNKGFEPFGPWARIRKVFLFKGFGAQKIFFIKGLRVLGPVRASILAFLAFLGRPKTSDPGKVFFIRVKVS